MKRGDKPHRRRKQQHEMTPEERRKSRWGSHSYKVSFPGHPCLKMELHGYKKKGAIEKVIEECPDMTFDVQEIKKR